MVALEEKSGNHFRIHTVGILFVSAISHGTELAPCTSKKKEKHTAQASNDMRMLCVFLIITY